MWYLHLLHHLLRGAPALHERPPSLSTAWPSCTARKSCQSVRITKVILRGTEEILLRLKAIREPEHRNVKPHTPGTEAICTRPITPEVWAEAERNVADLKSRPESKAALAARADIEIGRLSYSGKGRKQRFSGETVNRLQDYKSGLTPPGWCDGITIIQRGGRTIGGERGGHGPAESVLPPGAYYRDDDAIMVPLDNSLNRHVNAPYRVTWVSAGDLEIAVAKKRELIADPSIDADFPALIFA